LIFEQRWRYAIALGLSCERRKRSRAWANILSSASEAKYCDGMFMCMLIFWRVGVNNFEANELKVWAGVIFMSSSILAAVVIAFDMTLWICSVEGGAWPWAREYAIGLIEASKSNPIVRALHIIS
jgi:hypothetical protein